MQKIGLKLPRSGYARSVADARRIDATGKWVTPGLIHAVADAGTNVAGLSGFSEAGAEGDVTPSFSAAEGFNPAAFTIGVARTGGVTTGIMSPRGAFLPGSAFAVDLAGDRLEDMLATTKRHPSIIRHRTGVTRDGRLVAMDVEVVLDGGAYVTLSPVVLSRGGIHAAGPYRCDNMRIRGRAMMTHTPPNGAFRGFGAPQTQFAVEVHMERIAEALGMHFITVLFSDRAPEDIGGMHVARGILTARGGRTSHAAVVAVGMGKPCIVGAGDLVISVERRVLEARGRIVREGDIIAIDGDTGEVLLDRVRPKLTTVRMTVTGLVRWGYRVQKVEGTTLGPNLRSGSREGKTPVMTWNGLDASGARVPDGAYRVTLWAEDISGNRSERGFAVTVDTQHAWAAGYDWLGRYDECWEEFDSQVGLKWLAAFHLNDSKQPCGSRLDRHDTAGEGHLGKEFFRRLGLPAEPNRPRN